MKYLMIQGGVVQSVGQIAASAETARFSPPAGMTMIEVDDGHPAAEGWTVRAVNGVTEFLAPSGQPTPGYVPAEITRLQLILGLNKVGLITDAEALAASKRASIPALIDGVFNSLQTAAALEARIRWNDMTSVERVNPLVGGVAYVASKTEAQMDDYWREWSTL